MGWISARSVSLSSTNKRRPPLQVITPPGLVDHHSSNGQSSFLSYDYEGKVLLVQEISQKWVLALTSGSQQVPSNLEATQIYFMDVCTLSICNLFPSASS